MNDQTNEISKFDRLTPDQLAQVDKWLFDEVQTYKQVAARCEKEFGTSLSITSIYRYYQREAKRRANQTDAPNLSDLGAAAWRLGFGADSQYRDLIQTAGRMALTAARERRQKISLKLAVEMMRLQVAARREANQAQKVALQREKLEFDAATACLLHQLEIQKIVADESLDEGAQIQAIRHELFGPNLPE